MVKRIFLGIGLILVLLVVWQRDLVWYGILQGRGQLGIVWSAREVSDVLADPGVSDSVKNKLRYVEQVRMYAVNSLGLNDTENYTTLFDQQGRPVLWVVTGTRPFAFEPYEWRFPVVGTMPYKGYFEYDLAVAEMNRVKAEGYDAGIRTVGGWSTLGWFRDPILSNMLFRSKGDLANLVIHELVHATIFVKDSVNFNENLASFIGDKGAEMFLTDEFGPESAELADYLTEMREEQQYADHILRGADLLAEFYAGSSGMDSLKRQGMKDALIKDIVESMDSLSFSRIDRVQERLLNELPNNTYFMSFIRYRERQGDLGEMFRNKYGNDVKRMITDLKATYPYL